MRIGLTVQKKTDQISEITEQGRVRQLNLHFTQKVRQSAHILRILMPS